MALDDRQILSIIAEELAQSAGGNENDFIDANRQQSLAYYLGQMTGAEEEGRSSIVSTDVADAIEWIMPEIMKAFTQNNEIVQFDPTSAQDEIQAELESQFVYDVLMKDNNGFLVIHQFVKDALMQKNGFIKCFFCDEPEIITEVYTGLLEDQVAMVLAQDGVEMVQATTYEKLIEGVPYQCTDMKVAIERPSNKVVVMSVPPEEFRINKMHNEMDVSTARFTAHVMLRTAGELVERGIPKEVVDTLPTAQVYEDDREYRFYMQNETVYPDRDISRDPSLRTIEIAECYTHMDVNEDGMAEMVKIETTGGDNPDVLLDMEDIDENPFISTTAILMSHKFFGLSIFDRLKQIQDQKTSLWRNIFDNMYLQNNQRNLVLKNQCNLDDLLTSRPGGIIRVARTDAVQPYVTPPLSSDAYKMMDYLDQVRAGRAGVSPEGSVTDNMIGDRVGSEGIDRMMNQKEELVGLMIRVIAETGIKPLCIKIRNLLMKHQNAVVDYKFRGEWVQVNPANWKERKHTSVRVGTGTGNKQQQQSALTMLSQMQEKILQQPGQAMVKPEGVFKLLNDFSKVSGLAGAGSYFVDPRSQEGQQFQQEVAQQQQQQQQMEIQKEVETLKIQQQIAGAEVAKAEAQMANVNLKGEVEFTKNQLAMQKQEADFRLQVVEQQLKEAEAMIKSIDKDNELEYKYYDSDQRADVELERIDSQEKIAGLKAKDGSNQNNIN